MFLIDCKNLMPENVYAMIYYDFCCYLTHQKYMGRLVFVFGDEASSKTTVYRWFLELTCGLASMQYKSRVVVSQKEDSIDAVHIMIDEYLPVIIRRNSGILAHYRPSIHSISHAQLAVRKFCSYWILRKCKEK